MNKRLLILIIGWMAFALVAQGQHSVFQQKVSIQLKDRSIESVLKELTALYGFNFSYGNDLLPLQEKVSLQAENLPLGELLDLLFKNRGVGYSQIGSQILLQPALNSRLNAKRTISGYVTDAISGEALPGATIKESTVATISNTYGFYSLSLPAAPTKLQIRYLGYAPLEVRLAASPKDSIIAFVLQPLSDEMAAVNIFSHTETDLQQANTLSMRSMELKQLPRFMGEADAIKALQLMPGVQAGREGTSDLIVRGGSPDQNLILLDGVPVYNVAHLLGTFSVFNPDAIKNVELIKGGFPAPYGGRLSSVVDVQLKEGNNQKFSGEGAIGLISSKLLLEGPIKNEKTSFLIAARRTYLDMLTGAAAALSGEEISRYYFYDLNAKINHTFSGRDRLYLSVYGGRDQFADKQEFETQALLEQQSFNMRWGNATAALRWNHVFSQKLFGNLTLTHSRYRFIQHSEQHRSYGSTATDRIIDYNSSISDWGGKLDFDFMPATNHHLRFGGSYTHHRFNPEFSRLQTDTLVLTVDSFSQINAHEFYTYAEDRLTLSRRLQAVAGLHYSGFFVNNHYYHSLQPRLSLGYTMDGGLSIRGSFATMTQYLHLLSNTSTGTPTDIWAPATDKVKPQQSWQTTLGVASRLAGDQLEVTADLYYKEMKDIAEFKDGNDFMSDFLRSGPGTNFSNFVAAPYEDRIASGRGWSYGTEWMLRKRQGKTSGWIGYTLAWSWRKLQDINYNRAYPYTYDSRHNATIVLHHQLSEKLSIGGSWVYRTGYMTSLPSASYKAYNEPVFQPGSSTWHVASVDYLSKRNNYRMPAYHRLDLSLTHSKRRKWGDRNWNVSVYNAYNRRNPYFLYLSAANMGDEDTPRRLYQVSIFQLIPSISWGFKF
jgi:hypothetical protein